MRIECKYDELLPLKDVEKMWHPDNENSHPESQVRSLSKIIAKIGIRHAIHVSKRSKKIAGGHGRLLAFKMLGYDEVPVIWENFENEIEEINYRSSDNIGQYAEFNKVEYTINLEKIGIDLEEIDLEEFGIIDFDPEIEKIEPQADEDEVPEKPQDTTVKLGDIWQLGDHRLMCGDATNIQHVEKLMNGEKADITFTSPPYNAGKNIRGHFYKNDNDDKTDNDYLQFLMDTSELAIQFSNYVFWNIQLLESNKYVITDFQSKRRNNIKDILILNKNQYPPHINKGTFGCKWEYVFVFSNNSKSRSFPCNWQGKFPNVIETENASQNQYAKTHKATFPVSFPTWIIEKMDFSKYVLDPFGGSGTTLIACEKTNRKCFMMELDPYYCDVIIQRWEKYTGQKAELLN